MSPSHPKSAASETPLAPLLKVDHPLVQLSSTLDWDYFEQEFASLASEMGRPPLPTRLMVGLGVAELRYELPKFPSL